MVNTMNPDSQTYQNASTESWTPDDVMCHPWLTIWDNTKCTKCASGRSRLRLKQEEPKTKELSWAFCPSNTESLIGAHLNSRTELS